MAEESLKTINIKGKEYVQVNERIKYFRSNEKFKGWSLSSEIVKIENGLCVIRAIVKDENDVIKATGIAYEKEDEGVVNKTSYIENCETSAWGRALGNLGIGIDVSIASSEEMESAINKQTKPPTEKQILYLRTLLKKLHKTKEQADEVTDKLETAEQASACIEKAQEMLDNA